MPENFLLTKHLCNPDLFSNLLVMDGKYVAVKGFSAKIPFVYGIDYLTHDIPFGELFVSEDELSFSVFFGKLKELGYAPRAVVADDRGGLKSALIKVFPRALLQLCHNHYLENLRRLLNIRTDERYHPFFHSLRRRVFIEAKNQQEVVEGLREVWGKHAMRSPKLQDILLEINNRRGDLFSYLQIKDCPRTTNLVELYNSHLQGRLKSIKGFESFASARTWLNAYLVRRRVKPLTDCDTKFAHLNGLASLQLTIRDPKDWPRFIPGVKSPQKQPER